MYITLFLLDSGFTQTLT